MTLGADVPQERKSKKESVSSPGLTECTKVRPRLDARMNVKREEQRTEKFAKEG